MTQIIYTIDNINYVLFSFVVTSIRQAKLKEREIKKFDGIVQSFSVTESFWNGKKITVNVLIPEKKAKNFSNS